MAKSKGTHSRKKHTRQFLRFPEVNGKIIKSVEIAPDMGAINDHVSGQNRSQF